VVKDNKFWEGAVSDGGVCPQNVQEKSSTSPRQVILKFMGHVMPQPFSQGIMSGLTLETPVTNLKSVALTVLEL